MLLFYLPFCGLRAPREASGRRPRWGDL